MPAYASVAVGDALSRAAIARMEETLSWYGDLPPRQRSWVGMVAQAGVRSFLTWLADPVVPPTVTSEVFGAAPRELTRAVSLPQTLDLVRTVVAVIEDHSPSLAADPQDPQQVAAVRDAVLRYSREVAFSAAGLYAQAAELRTTWDTRLEAILVDALMRGDAGDFLESRFSMLGWRRHPNLAVVAGRPRLGEDLWDATDVVREALRTDADDALVGLHGDALVAVVGTDGRVWEAATRAADRFGPGPLVVGPTVTDLADVRRSASAALAGLGAAPGLPDAPRPVLADDLLPERALRGDEAAVAALVTQVYEALGAAGPGLRETIAAYLESGGSLEGTARALFVHANTVRYRLRRAADLTGWDATSSRDAFVLRVGLSLGRMHAATL